MARWLFLGLCLLTLAAAVELKPTERPANGAPLGGRCDNSLECRYGLSCVGGEGPLSGQCAATCASDDACTERFGMQAVCIAVDLCAVSCSDNSVCPSGTACNDYGFCEIDQKLDD